MATKAVSTAANDGKRERLADCINIERVGPPAKHNDYICREEGCNWHREAVADDTAARQHANSHSKTMKCHIFEGQGHRSAEVPSARNKEKRATCKRFLETQRAHAVKKPRTVREKDDGRE
jgi:hypothetical protein